MSEDGISACYVNSHSVVHDIVTLSQARDSFCHSFLLPLPLQLPLQPPRQLRTLCCAAARTWHAGRSSPIGTLSTAGLPLAPDCRWLAVCCWRGSPTHRTLGSLDSPGSVPTATGEPRWLCASGACDARQRCIESRHASVVVCSSLQRAAFGLEIHGRTAGPATRQLLGAAATSAAGRRQ